MLRCGPVTRYVIEPSGLWYLNEAPQRAFRVRPPCPGWKNRHKHSLMSSLPREHATSLRNGRPGNREQVVANLKATRQGMLARALPDVCMEQGGWRGRSVGCLHTSAASCGKQVFMQFVHRLQASPGLGRPQDRSGSEKETFKGALRSCSAESPPQRGQLSRASPRLRRHGEQLFG